MRCKKALILMLVPGPIKAAIIELVSMRWRSGGVADDEPSWHHHRLAWPIIILNLVQQNVCRYPPDFLDRLRDGGKLRYDMGRQRNIVKAKY